MVWSGGSTAAGLVGVEEWERRRGMPEKKPSQDIYSQNLEGMSERKAQWMSSVEEEAKSGTAAHSRGWSAGWRKQGVGDGVAQG